MVEVLNYILSVSLWKKLICIHFPSIKFSAIKISPQAAFQTRKVLFLGCFVGRTVLGKLCLSFICFSKPSVSTDMSLSSGILFSGSKFDSKEL